MDHLVCGAYHSDIAPDWAKIEQVDSLRIFACNPEHQKTPFFFPVGVDDQTVFDGQNALSRVTFFAQFNNRKAVITLTYKEKQLLISSGIIQPERLFCFEEMYPFFTHIKFVNHAVKNHTLLVKMLRKISELKIKGGATDFWSKKFMYKVARKVRKRSNLDAAFAHSSSLAYQEVFTLMESRPQRKIIALDFNSMYADCMAGDFPDPANLRFEKINKYYQSGMALANGLYRVCLIHPTGLFIGKFHALKYAFLNKKYAFSLSDKQNIEVLLHSNEVEYYAHHFEKIYIKEGVVSAKSIAHPLYRDSQRIYSLRLHYRRQGNRMLERLCKLQIATMYGSVKRKKYRSASFPDFTTAHQFLENNFGLKCPISMQPSEFLNFLSDGKRFTITIDTKIHIRYLTHHASSLLFSLYSQVIANARVKMMQTIEFMSQFPELEVCYCNIDSIHVSLPKESIHSFYEYIAPLMGNDMGKLKMEIQADHGYWFEPGRYWLIRDNAVVQFKNQGVHNHYVDDPFQDGYSYYKTYKDGEYTIPVKCRRDIAGTLTYNKKLITTAEPDHRFFERYCTEDLASINDIQNSLMREIQNSAEVKMDLFAEIAQKYR